MAEKEGSSRSRDESGRFVSNEQAESEEQGRDERDAAEAETEATDGDPQRGAAEAETEATGADQQSGAREGERGNDSGVEDISDTTAPSIGPGSVVKREPVEARLARHEQSNVDAMGHDKRRQVVGKTYGPTLARQLVLYGIFLVIVAAIAFGVKVAVDHFDQPPKHFSAQAPWAQKGAKQIPPKPLQ